MDNQTNEIQVTKKVVTLNDIKDSRIYAKLKKNEDQIAVKEILQIPGFYTEEIQMMIRSSIQSIFHHYWSGIHGAQSINSENEYYVDNFITTFNQNPENSLLELRNFLRQYANSISAGNRSNDVIKYVSSNLYNETDITVDANIIFAKNALIIAGADNEYIESFNSLRNGKDKLYAAQNDIRSIQNYLQYQINENSSYVYSFVRLFPFFSVIIVAGLSTTDIISNYRTQSLWIFLLIISIYGAVKNIKKWNSLDINDTPLTLRRSINYRDNIINDIGKSIVPHPLFKKYIDSIIDRSIDERQIQLENASGRIKFQMLYLPIIFGIISLYLLFSPAFLGSFLYSSSNKQEISGVSPTIEQKQTNETKTILGNQQDNASVSSDLALGGISIGDSTDKIFQHFGNPVKQENKSGGKIYYYYPSIEIHCLNGKVVTLVSNSPDAKTPKGVGESSPIADVLTAYGDNYTQFQYGGEDIYEYEMASNNGTPMLLRFAIKNGVVDYISIRRKTASESTSATQNVQTQSQSKTSSSVTDQMTEAPRFAAIKVFRAFHLSISDHKLRKAYDYFSEDMKNYMSYDGWAPGFNATVRSVPLDIQVAEESPDRVVLTYVLEAVDSPGGTHHFNGTTVLIKTNQGWKIDDIINKAR